MSGCSVFDLNRGRKLDETSRVKCVTRLNVRARVSVSSLSLFLSLCWRLDSDSILLIVVLKYFDHGHLSPNGNIFFLNSNDTRSCLYAR